MGTNNESKIHAPDVEAIQLSLALTGAGRCWDIGLGLLSHGNMALETVATPSAIPL